MTDLEKARIEINRIDAEMARLFEERMHAAASIAAYKQERCLPIRDPDRERALIDRNRALIGDHAISSYYIQFLQNTIRLSCDYQSALMREMRAADAGTEGSSASMMLSIRHRSADYDITLRRGALADAGTLMRLDRKVLIVTDDGVPAGYADSIAAQCLYPFRITIPAGERSKCSDQLKRLLSAMVSASFTRNDCIVAVGGGVAGDLSGLAASCYMRGIDFYNVPTTLLSQLDSSIGGKTAIDFEGLKNIVGAFYPPKGVLIDPDTLKTLNARQLHAGLAEAIKMGMTGDAGLFALIESCGSLNEALPEIIRRALLVKKSVVEQDPTENGLRRSLNFGHTIGHAIESASGGSLLHGECVALGMLPMCSSSVRSRLRDVLYKYDLPVRIDQAPDQLLPYLTHDKKMLSDRIRTVWVDEIGSFRFADLTPAEILKNLEKAQ